MRYFTFGFCFETKIFSYFNLRTPVFPNIMCNFKMLSFFEKQTPNYVCSGMDIADLEFIYGPCLYLAGVLSAVNKIVDLTV